MLVRLLNSGVYEVERTSQSYKCTTTTTQLIDLYFNGAKAHSCHSRLRQLGRRVRFSDIQPGDRVLTNTSGLEADQKVIAAHGCYAMTATTALTAQNTLGVYDIHHTPPEFLQKQIDACIEDIGVDVIKTGA